MYYFRELRINFVRSKLFSSAPLFNITEKDVNKMPAFQNFFCGKLRLIRGPSDEERFSRDLANLHEAGKK